MKIYYHFSEYISHRRAGEAYAACLAAMGHELTANPAASDLVVLHDDPIRYPALLERMPAAPGRKYVGYAVWETPQLPAVYQRAVAGLDAVWTASAFSREAFAPHCRAFVLPHVVARLRPAQADIRRIMALLGMQPSRREDRNCMYFYTIVDTVNPRKNIETLLSAFSAAFPETHAPVRLVVKQYRMPQPLDAFPHVIDIPEMLDDGMIAALHAVCDCYVSAHHAEAWGLPLSEAMSFGNPVIATGYSGNMEFMTARNSFPVPYAIAPVSERMCRALPEMMEPHMTWANIDTAALVHTLRRLRAQPVDAAFRATVAQSMQAFAPQAICGTLQELLDAL